MTSLLPFRFDRNVLPPPDSMSRFWGSVFPVLSLLSDFVQNDGAYWRRIQKILAHISKNSNFPCPFNQFPQFKDAFNSVCATLLQPRSLDQIVACLELMPRCHDPQVLLWRAGEVIGGGSSVLHILYELSTRNHDLWSLFLKSEGATELLLDRLLPHIDPAPRQPQTLELRFMSLFLCERAFLDRPPASDRLPDAIDSLVTRIANVMASESPIELKVELFRVGARVLKSTSIESAVEKFIDASLRVPVLRPLVESFSVSLGYPLAKLSTAVFAGTFDHNDVSVIADQSVRSQGLVPVRTVQKLAETAAGNEVLGRTCCFALERILPLASDSQRWVKTFIGQAVGFVIIAQGRGECRNEVGMVMDVLAAMSRANVEWLKADVSEAAATLMASQTVNMAMVNALKPSVRFDGAAIQKWSGEKAQAVDLRTMLRDVREERAPAPPKASGSVPPRKILPVHARRSMSMPGSLKLPAKKKTCQRPTVPVVKANKLFR